MDQNCNDRHSRLINEPRNHLCRLLWVQLDPQSNISYRIFIEKSLIWPALKKWRSPLFDPFSENRSVPYFEFPLLLANFLAETSWPFLVVHFLYDDMTARGPVFHLRNSRNNATHELCCLWKTFSSNELFCVTLVPSFFVRFVSYSKRN